MLRFKQFIKESDRSLEWPMGLRPDSFGGMGGEILTPRFNRGGGLGSLAAKNKESNKVFRIDDKEIPDFSKNMKTYHSNKSGTESGTFNDPKEIPSDWVAKTGIYGTTNKAETVGYVFPRGTKNVTVERPGKTTMVIDKPSPEGHTPTISTFEKTPDWKKTAGSEVFTSSPNKPISQEKISNPMDFAKQQGVKVIVGDPNKFRERVQSVLDKKNPIERFLANRKIRITGEQ